MILSTCVALSFLRASHRSSTHPKMWEAVSRPRKPSDGPQVQEPPDAATPTLGRRTRQVAPLATPLSSERAAAGPRCGASQPGDPQAQLRERKSRGCPAALLSARF